MNIELVETIVAMMGEFPVSEIAITREGQRVSVRRPLSVAPLVSAITSAATPIAEDAPSAEPLAEPSSVEGRETQTLTALMVGIFHQADPPLSYAAEVRPGQVVGYIESMKLLNDVVAEESGQVIDVLVEEGAPVEYGQALFRLSVSPSA